MKKNYVSTVEFEGKTYFCQEAIVNDDGKGYTALAEDEEGNEFKVSWDVTETWNKLEEEMKNRFRELTNKCYDEDRQYDMKEENNIRSEYGIFEDESNACDWDNPCRVVEN